MDLYSNTYRKIAIKKKSPFYYTMQCRHDFLKMSHHRANTKYGENTSFIHQEIIYRHQTALMLLYLATFTNLTPNNIQKICVLSVFQECPTIVHLDGGTYLKLANKIQKRRYKLNKSINYMRYLTNWPFFGVKIVLLVLLAQW